MISATPASVKTQASQGYSGRASDKAIFEHSGLFQLLDPVLDTVMADRGFLIDGYVQSASSGHQLRCFRLHAATTWHLQGCYSWHP